MQLHNNNHVRARVLSRSLLTLVGLLSLSLIAHAEGDTLAENRVDTSSTGLVAKVAPGELLPLSVKLSNFGGSKRVDVLIEYSILTNSEEKIYTSNETVAVETTANFVKKIPVPSDTAPGAYKARTSIVYGGQLVPATTQFPFTVERKIFGVFRGDFFLYGGCALLTGILMTLFGYALIRHHRTTRFAPADYSDIPRDSRVFYELISDTILGMRQQVGERALDIAKQVGGLAIDEKTGRVLKLTEKPSKIIAELVSEYEKALGKKVSFSFRRS
jgi:hypothetical protein